MKRSLKDQIRSPLPRHRPPSKTMWEKAVTNYRLGAERRGILFDLDAAYLERLFDEQGGKCAISGLPIEFAVKTLAPTASLDRIESHRGYLAGNVQWVHKAINQMKWDNDEAYFIAMCMQVAAHRGLGTELTVAERRALAGQKQISADRFFSSRRFNRFVKRQPKADEMVSIGGMLF